MAVGDTESFVLSALTKAGHKVTQGATFEWLTGRGPLEPEASMVSEDVRERLLTLHADLGGSHQKLATKARQRLPVDFQIEGRVLLELDETQHFSSARERTLDFYDDLHHDLDVARYRDLCVQYRANADAYFKNKTAADFPFPGGRTAQRAYLDAVRDFLAPAHGFRLIRIPAPARNARKAALMALEAVQEVTQ